MKPKPVNHVLIILFGIILMACQNVHIKIDTNSSEKADSLQQNCMTYQTDIEKEDLNSLLTEINIPAGKINVRPCADKLMKGFFEYTREEWKPKITYMKEDHEGYLKIGPKGNRDEINFEDSDICRYHIDLCPDIKQELKIVIGAGNGEINLENFNLKSFELAIGAGELFIQHKNTSVPELDLKAGAGKLTVNLCGEWNNDLTADIAGGVGEIILLLPDQVGINAEISGLLGDINAPGFLKEGNIYKSKNLSKSPHTLNLEIAGAIGSVKLLIQE